jgi:hypothetical protein
MRLAAVLYGKPRCTAVVDGGLMKAAEKRLVHRTALAPHSAPGMQNLLCW